jgi:hypothetical protein
MMKVKASKLRVVPSREKGILVSRGLVLIVLVAVGLIGKERHFQAQTLNLLAGETFFVVSTEVQALPAAVSTVSAAHLATEAVTNRQSDELRLLTPVLPVETAVTSEGIAPECRSQVVQSAFSMGEIRVNIVSVVSVVT